MTESIAALVGETAAPWVILALIVFAIVIAFLILRWIWSMIRGGTYINGGRGRQPRLAVLDATPIDNRRRLVLVRRDNVEHLILIGGMNDLVVEGSIEKTAAIQTPERSTTATAPAKPAKQATPKPVAKPTPAPTPQAKKPATKVTTSAVAGGGAVLGAAAAQVGKTADNAVRSTGDAVASVQSKIEDILPDLTPEIAADEPSSSIIDSLDEALETVEPVEIATSKEPVADFETPTIEPALEPAPEINVAELEKTENIEDEMERLLNQLTTKPS